MIHCLLVDDEPLAIQVLKKHIEAHPKLQLVGAVRSALKAMEVLETQQIDLLFLDIQMPQLTGLDFAKSLQNPPQIVFTTAFREFAVESYEVNALDYLIKPISFARLCQSIERYKQVCSPEANQETIFIKADNKQYRLRVEELIFVESLKDCIILHTQSQQITAYQSLQQLEKQLPTGKFLRIHRSFLIALEHLTAFNASAVFLDKEELPIGRTYKKHALQTLELLKK